MTAVAVVQDAPVAFDLERTLTKTKALVAEAAKRGAELVVLPEAFISAYPKGLDFGAKVGTRSDEGREIFRRYYDSSIDVPGPAADRLGAIAKTAGVDLVIGVIERHSGTLYCSALIYGRDGALLGKHRKLVPTAAERVVWGQGDGSTLPVVDTGAGKIGAVICWENYMPMLRMTMYAKGIQIYCAPTVDDRDAWHHTMRHIAVEGRCFVLACCQYATRADYPADYESPYGDDPATVMIRGGSCIVDPFGNVLAGPAYGERTVLTADLDMDQIVRGKYDLDVVGHYARPDVFELRVDERAKSAVEPDAEIP